MIHSFIEHLNYELDPFLGIGDAINKAEQDPALKISLSTTTYLELICFRIVLKLDLYLSSIKWIFFLMRI